MDSEFQDFAATHTIQKIIPQFFQQNGKAIWTAFVMYEEGETSQKPDIPQEDPAAGLSEEQRKLYEILRKWRNDTARKEYVNPYILFNNAQLAKIAEFRPKTLAKLGEIHGIGDIKLKKYGKIILEIVNVSEKIPTSEIEKQP